jgi:hypothetical protein
MDVDVNTATAGIGLAAVPVAPRFIGDDGVLGTIYNDCRDTHDVPERAVRLRAAMQRLEDTTSFEQVLPLFRELDLHRNDDLHWLASDTVLALHRVNIGFEHTTFDDHRAYAIMERLVVRSGCVPLAKFMRERGLDLLSSFSTLHEALAANSPEMLTYLDDEKLIEPAKRHARMYLGNAVRFGYVRGLEWMLQRGYATLEACATEGYITRHPIVIKRLLELGMQAPKKLYGVTTPEAVQVMLDFGVPTSYWSDCDSAIRASEDVHALLLSKGWVPAEEISRYLVVKRSPNPNATYVLRAGLFRPTLDDMKHLVFGRQWATVREILEIPGAFDISHELFQEFVGRWSFIYLECPFDIRQMLEDAPPTSTPTRIRLRRLGGDTGGFQLMWLS